MNLYELGYHKIEDQIKGTYDLDSFSLGRIMAEHKERYLVGTEEGEVEAEITGNMRFSASSREDFPAVGDWVLLLSYEPGKAIINEILPRLSMIKRQAVGQFGEMQIIGSNIDYAFIMQALDRDFNLNRLERYISLCYAAKVEPIVLLNKVDLIDEETLNLKLKEVSERLDNLTVIAISNESKRGYDALVQHIKAGYTYCLLGSSGVGKSSLLNNLSDSTLMKTDHISASNNKGRHVSSHRELTILKNGAILIDNPGMREVGMADSESGLEMTYDKIVQLAEECRYRDCTHTTEDACAVLEAMEQGELDPKQYQNFLKLQKENTHFESTVHERRKKDKAFGRMVKDVKKYSLKK